MCSLPSTYGPSVIGTSPSSSAPRWPCSGRAAPVEDPRPAALSFSLTRAWTCACRFKLGGGGFALGFIHGEQILWHAVLLRGGTRPRCRSPPTRTGCRSIGQPRCRTNGSSPESWRPHLHVRSKPNGAVTLAAKALRVRLPQPPWPPTRPPDSTNVTSLRVAHLPTRRRAYERYLTFIGRRHRRHLRARRPRRDHRERFRCRRFRTELTYFTGSRAGLLPGFEFLWRSPANYITTVVLDAVLKAALSSSTSRRSRSPNWYRTAPTAGPGWPPVSWIRLMTLVLPGRDQVCRYESGITGDRRRYGGSTRARSLARPARPGSAPD